MLAGCTQKSDNNQNEKDMTTLTLTKEWDKVFPLSEKVSHRKVTFTTQYGLTLAADLYTPKAPLSSPQGGGVCCDSSKRAVRSHKGAVERTLRNAHGRAWLCSPGLRSLLHG